ncbi:hypothetical protein F5883DRAFT_29779 [Diaporthe sp. PMI_573]|nr:hypothetical protein F5883DRAFT_29779 [Diaporthaceae sp. PMI_573]
MALALALAMELPAAVQAEEAPSHPVVEEPIVAAADTAAVATVAEEIVVVLTEQAEIAARTVVVVIGAGVAVTEVAAADAHLRGSTHLPPDSDVVIFVLCHCTYVCIMRVPYVHVSRTYDEGPQYS